MQRAVEDGVPRKPPLGTPFHSFDSKMCVAAFRSSSSAAIMSIARSLV